LVLERWGDEQSNSPPSNQLGPIGGIHQTNPLNSHPVAVDEGKVLRAAFAAAATATATNATATATPDTAATARAFPRASAKPPREPGWWVLGNHLPHGSHDRAAASVVHDRLWCNHASVGDVDTLNYVPIVLHFIGACDSVRECVRQRNRQWASGTLSRCPNGGAMQTCLVN
jgi:hypothetical protein